MSKVIKGFTVAPLLAFLSVNKRIDGTFNGIKFVGVLVFNQLLFPGFNQFYFIFNATNR